MAGVVLAIFVYVLFLCAAGSQPIYFNEKNDCVCNDQTIQTLNKKIDSIRQECTRQIYSLKQENVRQIDSLKQEIARIRKNETNIHENLETSILQIDKSEFNIYIDCKDLYNNGNTEPGVYEIYPFGTNSKVSVFCDMVTEGGGWTTRVSGSVLFGRTWVDNKEGFGNVTDSYWIGHDVVHQLTKERNSTLYISITLTNGTKLYIIYDRFSVENETNYYRLFLGGPAIGTLGDSMRSGHSLSGMYFSTPDRDNDGCSCNCAAHSNKRGGWWFNDCHHAFLNGKWSPESWYNPWYPTVTDNKQIKETLMMIKPH